MKASQLIPPLSRYRANQPPSQIIFMCCEIFFFFPTEMSAIYLIAALELETMRGFIRFRGETRSFQTPPSGGKKTRIR